MDAVPKKNIHLLYGENTYGSYQKSRLWKSEFEKKYGDFNAHIFEGAKLTSADFQSVTQSVPFLSEKKLVLISDFLRDGSELDQKKVAEALDTIADFCVIVFIEEERPDARTTIFKKLKKTALVQEFQPPTGPELAAWIQKQVSQKNGSIDFKEAVFLAETVGPDLWQISREIEKLILYSAGQPINNTDIEALVSPNLGSSIFKLTDQLAQKNARLCLKTLKILLESGEDIVKILFMIVRHFRILIEVRACLDQGLNKAEIIQKTAEHPFVVTTTINQGRNFKMETLKGIYRQLLQIDCDLKSGKIKITAGDTRAMQLVIEKFIVDWCQTDKMVF